MAHILYTGDEDIHVPGISRTIYDPACGTGGMLSVSEEYIREQNPQAHLTCTGRITMTNPMRSAARTCSSRMSQSIILFRRHARRRQDLGRSRRQDVPLHAGQSAIRRGVETSGEASRKGIRAIWLRWPFWRRLAAHQRWRAAIPSRHMISKTQTRAETAVKDRRSPSSSMARPCSPAMRDPAKATSGAGSSRMTGSTRSSPCPTSFSTTPASYTYIWIVSNRKAKQRRGKVQLIDGTRHFQKMKKSLGNKRNELSPEQIDEITKLYSDFNKERHARSLSTGRCRSASALRYLITANSVSLS